MRILIIQFVAPGRSQPVPRFRHDLGVAAAMLRADGFDVALLPLDGRSEGMLHKAVTETRPTHLLVDIPATHVTAARHTIVDVAEKHYLPVTVVGRYATCQPEQAISIPGVTAMILGEYEPSVLRLYRCVRDGSAVMLARPGEARSAGQADIPGVWFNSEDGLVRNDPAPLAEDLDALPFPDRELFDYAREVRQTGQALFAATRGCDRWCAFCLSDWYMELYRRNGPLLRRRSVEHLLEEVSAVVGRYEGVRRVTFCDHAFVCDPQWLERFADEYPRRCGLPYRCHVRPADVDTRVAGMLADSGCETAEVEIGSGSRFIREDVLAMRTSENQIVAGVAALKGAGLRVHGRAFVGAPYDSEVTVEETLALLGKLRLDAVQARVYFPVPGTRAAEMCAENGWISGRAEENFHANCSVLDMPTFPAARIDEIARRFEVLLKRRRGRTLRAWLKKLRRLGTRPLHLSRQRRKRPASRGRSR